MLLLLGGLGREECFWQGTQQCPQVLGHLCVSCHLAETRKTAGEKKWECWLVDIRGRCYTMRSRRGLTPQVLTLPCPKLPPHAGQFAKGGESSVMKSSLSQWGNISWGTAEDTGNVEWLVENVVTTYLSFPAGPCLCSSFFKGPPFPFPFFSSTLYIRCSGDFNTEIKTLSCKIFRGHCSGHRRLSITQETWRWLR